MSSHRDFASNYEATGPREAAPKAILLKRELTSYGLSVIAFAVLLAVVSPGLLLGALTAKAELGIGLSAAIAGTLALGALFHCNFGSRWR